LDFRDRKKRLMKTTAWFVIFIKYWYNYKTKVNQMGSTYSTYGDNGILCKILVENFKETALLDARILLQRHLKKLDINLWVGYVWMGSSGGLFRICNELSDYTKSAISTKVGTIIFSSL